MLDHLGDSQQKILHTLLKADGPITTETLGGILAISKNAAYQHVNSLVSAGYIAKVRLQRTGGRPSQSYSLTEAGKHLFPKRYAKLTNTLLDILKVDLEPDKIDAYLAALGEKLGDTYIAQFEGRPRAERTKALTAVLQEIGYEPEADQPNKADQSGFTIHNCIYQSVAKNHKDVCKIDIALFSRLLGADVCMTACLAKGDNCCSFVIAKDN